MPFFGSLLALTFMKKKIIRVSTVPCSLDSFLEGFLKRLSEDYEVIALSSPEPELEKVGMREGVRTIAVPMERHISLFKDIVSLFRLIYVFAKEHPDMVHSMTPKAGLLSMLAAWLTRVPVRIHTFTGLVFPIATGLKRKILMCMDGLTCACSTYVNPESKGVANDLKRFGITKKPLHIIANGNVRGVDMSYYARTPEVMEKANELRDDKFITFCFVGRIVGDKGINELISAFDRLSKNHSNTRLFLVGPREHELDPLTDTSESILAENKHICLFGMQSDIRPYLAASDYFVFPSYREGMPNVVLEAGAMGLPSIVTNINGSNEIIIDGENGVIIPVKDEEALHQTMTRWVEHREEPQKMADKARRMIEDRYEQQMIWKATLDEYHCLLEDLK